MKSSDSQKPAPPFRVLFLSSEITPFLKSGGLADVAGSLPLALKKVSPDAIDIRVVTTSFAGIRKHGSISSRGSFLFPSPFGVRKADVFHTRMGDGKTDVPIYFIGVRDLFERSGLYGEKEVEYPDNFERFSLWSHAIREWVKKEPFIPDVVHGNDWQTGLFFPLLQTWKNLDRDLIPTRSLFTIHNLAYKGLFPLKRLVETGLPEQYGHFSKLEFYGYLSFLKGGICCTDVVTTVSPGYRNEVLREPEGEGLSGALRARGKEFTGILNGMDIDHWNPETDPRLKEHYSALDHSAKKRAKSDLLELFGIKDSIHLPLVAMVTRMTPQKGLDIALSAIATLLKKKEKIRIVVLGSGSPELEAEAIQLAHSFKGVFGLTVGFDDDLARKIYAGSDFFLMPSRFEPCGLSQMYAMRYGTIPVVNPTGGLKDTVTPGKTGIWLGTLSIEGVIQGMEDAMKLYSDRKTFNQYRTNAMLEENGWPRRAEQYRDLYEGISGKTIRRI
ncbi:MAG: glycogen synthase [Leptospirales bacterium]